jgi:RNA-directed DNA polymerase
VPNFALQTSLVGGNVSLVLSSSGEELREQFFALRSPRDIARLLEVDYSVLVYHLYKVRSSKKYTVFPVRKKSGGYRQISAPVTALKIIQQKLNQVLLNVYQPKPSVHSYVLGRSIVTNAERHCEKRYVFNIDLKDFFPSINYGRVRGMFMAIPYECDEAVATVLAQICCFNNQLPQGAPSSPIVSNMICAKMDTQLQRLARRHRSFYTRYADDITFSTNLRNFPFALAGVNAAGQVEVGPELLQVIQDNGFEVNPDKVRLRTRNRRQEVTGLTTNSFPNVRRRYVRQIRAMLHARRKYGLQAAQEEFLTLYDQKHRSPDKAPPLFKQVVKGRIEFLGMVRGEDDVIYRRFLKQLRDLAPELVEKPIDELEALVMEYDELRVVEGREGRQRRGYVLENLLNRVFRLYGIHVEKSFKRNEGAEQIDGAFILDNHYLVECRWREKPADTQQVDGLMAKVVRSGRLTLGLFLSINGWSANVPPTLKQNPQKAIILMNGEDLRCVLSGEIDLARFIRAKTMYLNFRSEPFYGASQYLADQVTQEPK